MKTMWAITFFCCIIAVPAFSQVSLKPDDLDKIRLIVNDVVKKEITDSEARMKDYVNVRFDSIERQFDGVEKRFVGIEKRFEGIEKQIESVDKRVTQGINITYGLIALIVVAVNIPQVISVWQGRQQKELDRKIDTLVQRIEMLEQQRIVNP